VDRELQAEVLVFARPVAARYAETPETRREENKQDEL
jgi:hypothetical protein